MRNYHVVNRGYWTVNVYLDGDTVRPSTLYQFKSYTNAFSFFRRECKYAKRVFLFWSGIVLPEMEYGELLVAEYDRELYESTGQKYSYNSCACFASWKAV